jgi:hypothetical protein
MKKSLINRKVAKDLLFIQKNILNQGPLAGMPIRSQILKIKSVLEKWLQTKLSENGKIAKI